MSIADLTSEVIRPSALSTSDVAAWHAMMAQSPFLQRGFFAPEFALSCERAHDLARVLVFRRGLAPVAFFPFQFPSHCHRMAGAGERIGGDLSDHAGVIARPDFRIEPRLLLAAARLKALFVTHLNESQAAFGLTGQDSRTGHVVDLRDCAEQYLQELSRTRFDFVRDTQRRLRRAERDFGTIQFSFDMAPTLGQARQLLDAKRNQYARTGVSDVFGNPSYMAVIESLFEYPSVHCRPAIAILRAGSHVLAQHLGLISQGVLSYWFPVYDTKARAISPGRLLLWHTIQAAGKYGIKFIDRGEGDSRAKQDFSTGVQRFSKAYWHRGTMALPARTLYSIQWRFNATHRV